MVGLIASRIAHVSAETQSVKPASRRSFPLARQMGQRFSRSSLPIDRISYAGLEDM